MQALARFLDSAEAEGLSNLQSDLDLEDQADNKAPVEACPVLGQAHMEA